VYPWLRHGFSTRLGGVSTVYDAAGDLNLGLTKDDDPAAVAGNRDRFLDTVGSGGLVTLRQIHSATSLIASIPGPCGEADGLITATPGITLGIQTADCTPVLVADIRQRVVAGFHAGWRGTVAGIVEHGMARMRTEFGCDTVDLVAAVGPAIGACCYTVGQEVEQRFYAGFGYAASLFEHKDSGLYLNLAEANRRQLLASGVAEEKIAMLPECTACTRASGRRKYFSHRAEQGFTGRMMSAIGILDGVG